MLCRIFFQIYIKNKTEITEIDIAEASRKADNQNKTEITEIDIAEASRRADNQNKTEITEIDIAESKIQLKKNKSATEPKKRGIRLNPREGEGTY